ncbi:MAG: hypothetical protein NT178_15070 [Proteobacteria bacterium]|nr:hypothetical protein [Pseudomonadota bacterium]
MNRTKVCIIGFTAIILGLFLICEAFCTTEGKDDNDFDVQKTKEFIVGTVVKLFAKGYIAVTDIDKIKETNIAKLKKMDDQEFANKYTAIYSDMKGLPQDVKTAYGIDEKMDRSAAIIKIQSAGKKDLYTIIDSIPDTFITKHFDSYIGEKGFDMKKPPSKREIMNFWNDIRKKLDAE